MPATVGFDTSIWSRHRKPKKPAAAKAKAQRAAQARVIRLLARDSSRRIPPPVSLAGRPADFTPAIPPPSPPAVARTRTPPSGHNGKAPDREPTTDDATGPYTPEQLESMNARFVARMELAFATGDETRAAAGATYRDRKR
jgi:hypothetical protein